MKVGDSFIHKNLKRSIYVVEAVYEESNQMLFKRTQDIGKETMVLVNSDDKGFINNMIPTDVPFEEAILRTIRIKVNEDITYLSNKVIGLNQELELLLSERNRLNRELDILEQAGS